MLTIEDFHEMTVTVEVNHYTPFSDRGAHARPGSAAWAEPPEGGEVEFDVLCVDTGLGINDCDPEDNIVPIRFISDHMDELNEVVFEMMSEPDDDEGDVYDDRYN